MPLDQTESVTAEDNISPYLLQPKRSEQLLRMQVLRKTRDAYVSGEISDGDAADILMRRLGYSRRRAADVTMVWDGDVSMIKEGEDYGYPRGNVSGQPIDGGM